MPWYRGNTIKLLHGGIIDNRTPLYLPREGDTTFTVAGSWCFKDDPVCSMNIVTGTKDAHGKYPERAIPDMALEIANAINYPLGVDKSYRPPALCSQNSKQDLVVLLDTSPIMRRDASIFTDTPMWDSYYINNVRQPARTAGKMLLDGPGCGDTRLAVVGYGREQDGQPQLLLDFTNKAADYDQLLKSLHQPAETGTYGRTQIREAGIFAGNVAWRPDAMKTVMVIGGTAGTGPLNPTKNWEHSDNIALHLADSLSQRLISSYREKDIALIADKVPLKNQGFTLDSSEPWSVVDGTYSYMKMLTSATGGYTWIRDNNTSYQPVNFKYSALDRTISTYLGIRSGTNANVGTVRAEVGKPVEMSVNDPNQYIAAAKLRGDMIDYAWFVDCANVGIRNIPSNKATVTFTPTRDGKCKAAVYITQKTNSANGCYWGVLNHSRHTLNVLWRLISR